jgi:hypothetical protein
MSELYACALVAMLSILMSISPTFIAKIDADIRRANELEIEQKIDRRVEQIKQINAASKDNG